MAQNTRRIIASGPFLEDWINHSLALIDTFRQRDSLEPLVLLPDDIQQEDYEPFFETLCGEAAEQALNRLSSEGQDHQARLIFIDFAPQVLPGDRGLLDVVNALSETNWPQHSLLVVHAPSAEAFAQRAFGEHLSRGRTPSSNLAYIG